MFNPYFKSTKLHFYLPIEQFSFFNQTCYFFTNAHYWTLNLLKKSSFSSFKMLFFILPIHLRTCSKSCNLTKTKSPTLMSLKCMHVVLRKDLWPIARDDWIFCINNIKCVQQGNPSMVGHLIFWNQKPSKKIVLWRGKGFEKCNKTSSQKSA